MSTEPRRCSWNTTGIATTVMRVPAIARNHSGAFASVAATNAEATEGSPSETSPTRMWRMFCKLLTNPTRSRVGCGESLDMRERRGDELAGEPCHAFGVGARARPGLGQHATDVDHQPSEQQHCEQQVEAIPKRNIAPHEIPARTQLRVRKTSLGAGATGWRLSASRPWPIIARATRRRRGVRRLCAYSSSTIIPSSYPAARPC